MAEFYSATVRSSDRFRGYFVSGIHKRRMNTTKRENGGDKLVHGSGGISQLRADTSVRLKSKHQRNPLLV